MGGLLAGEAKKLPVKGLFYGIGHKPNSGIVEGQIDLDEAGYVKVTSRHPVPRESLAIPTVAHLHFL